MCKSVKSGQRHSADDSPEGSQPTKAGFIWGKAIHSQRLVKREGLPQY